MYLFLYYSCVIALKKETLPNLSFEENRCNCNDLPKFVKPLKPQFSEEGSNSRQAEKIIYRTFLQYLKEVVGVSSMLDRVVKALYTSKKLLVSTLTTEAFFILLLDSFKFLQVIYFK